MPKVPKNFENSVIYSLVCKDITVKDCYVGSTTNFTARKYGHRDCCKNESKKEYNYYVYQFIRDNGGWDNWDMVELEKYPCSDFNEMFKRERYWMETLGATLNSRVPARSNKEYKEEHKEHLKQWFHDYHMKNRDERNRRNRENARLHKEEISAKRKVVHTCECGGKWTNCHYQRHCRTEKHQSYLNSK